MGSSPLEETNLSDTQVSFNLDKLKEMDLDLYHTLAILTINCISLKDQNGKYLNKESRVTATLPVSGRD